MLMDMQAVGFGGSFDLHVVIIAAAACVLDFTDTAPALCAATAVRGYGDGRTGKLFVVEMLIEAAIGVNTWYFFRIR